MTFVYKLIIKYIWILFECILCPDIVNMLSIMIRCLALYNYICVFVRIMPASFQGSVHCYFRPGVGLFLVPKLWTGLYPVIMLLGGVVYMYERQRVLSHTHPRNHWHRSWYLSGVTDDTLYIQSCNLYFIVVTLNSYVFICVLPHFIINIIN